MLADERSIGVGVRDHEQAADRNVRPALLARDDLRQDPNLALERAHGRLDVADAGLDFDDEQGPARRVPSDDVRRAALAEVVERDLDPGEPAASAEL